MKIIVVNGKPESGKTTFEKMVAEERGGEGLYTFLLSSIAPIKEIAWKCGWRGGKEPRDRKFLSDLKDLLTEYCDFSMEWLRKEIRLIEDEMIVDGVDLNRIWIFVDIREPEEIARFCKEWGAMSLLIRRPDHEIGESSNHADAYVDDYEYDAFIVNQGDLEHFRKQAKDFIFATESKRD